MERATETSEASTINYLVVTILTALGFILALGGQFVVERFTDMDGYSWLVPAVVWGLAIFILVLNDNTFMRRAVMVPLALATLETLPVVLIIAATRFYFTHQNLTFMASIVMGLYFFFRMVRAVHPFFHVGESLVYSDHSAVRKMNQDGKPEEGKRIIVRDFKKFKEEVEKTIPKEEKAERIIPFSAKGPINYDGNIGMDTGTGYSSPDEMWARMEQEVRRTEQVPREETPAGRESAESTGPKKDENTRKARSEALWGSLQVSKSKKNDNTGEKKEPEPENQKSSTPQPYEPFPPRVTGQVPESGSSDDFFFTEDFRQMTEGDDVASRSQQKISLEGYGDNEDFSFAEDFRNQMVKEDNGNASGNSVKEETPEDTEPDYEPMVDDRKMEDLPIFEMLGYDINGKRPPDIPRGPVMPDKPVAGFVRKKADEEAFDFEALMENRHKTNKFEPEPEQEPPPETPLEMPTRKWKESSDTSVPSREKSGKAGFVGIRHVEEQGENQAVQAVKKQVPFQKQQQQQPQKQRPQRQNRQQQRGPSFRKAKTLPPPPSESVGADVAARSRRALDFTPAQKSGPGTTGKDLVRSNPPAEVRQGGAMNFSHRKPAPEKTQSKGTRESRWHVVRNVRKQANDRVPGSTQKQPQKQDHPSGGKLPLSQKPPPVPEPPSKSFMAPVSSRNLFNRPGGVVQKRAPFERPPLGNDQGAPAKKYGAIPVKQDKGSLVQRGVKPVENRGRFKPVKASELWKTPRNKKKPG